jgi:hypothetical protein
MTINGLYEYWHPEAMTPQAIDFLEASADSTHFVRCEGIKATSNGLFLVQYEHATTAEALKRTYNEPRGVDDPTLAFSTKAHYLKILVNAIREVGDEWYPHDTATGTLNIGLVENNYPVLTRQRIHPSKYALTVGATTGQLTSMRSDGGIVRRNLHILEDFFVIVLGSDRATVAGYIAGDPVAVARVEQATMFTPPPYRAKPATVERRAAIAVFWAATLDSNATANLLQDWISTIYRNHRECFDAFMATPVNGVLPLTALVRKAARVSHIQMVIPILLYGADPFASNGDQSPMAAVAVNFGVAGIAAWCQAVGIDKIVAHTECHAEIIVAIVRPPIMNTEVASLKLTYLSSIGINIAAVKRPGEWTILHYIAAAASTTANYEVLARTVITLAPELLTVHANPPAFRASDPVLPYEVATTTYMKNMLTPAIVLHVNETPAIVIGDAVAPATVTPAIVTPAVVTPAVVTPAVVTPAVVTPAVVTPAVVTPAAVSPAVVTPAIMTPAVVTSAVVTPAAVTPTEVAPAVVRSAAGITQPDVLIAGYLSSLDAHTRQTFAQLEHQINGYLTSLDATARQSFAQQMLASLGRLTTVAPSSTPQ